MMSLNRLGRFVAVSLIALTGFQAGAEDLKQTGNARRKDFGALITPSQGSLSRETSQTLDYITTLIHDLGGERLSRSRNGVVVRRDIAESWGSAG